MDYINHSRLLKRYNIAVNEKKSINAERVKAVVNIYSKKFSPINSSLNYSATNSNVETAIDQASVRQYHFDKSIERELLKLHNKDIKTNETSHLNSRRSYKSLTPVAGLVISPIKSSHKRSQTIKAQPAKIIFPADGIIKSIPIHLDSNLKFKREKKLKIDKPKFNELEKMILNCTSKKNREIDILNKWIGAKTFDDSLLLNDNTYTKKKSVLEESFDQRDYTDSLSKISLTRVRKKKPWKLNHFGFIAQVDRKIYSIRKKL